ncbi:hypothetical protein [Paraclostridium dentum]|uniref:hypothetical protein n=1 Tax=Paraclostridium dentum TaxID=2662455 RepID=UPI003F40E229
MENKLLKDMSQEEIMQAMNLVKREGDNKARLANKGDMTRTITIEKFGCTATIETSVKDDVTVEVYEETDAQFGRRVRFDFKVQEFRQNAPAKNEAYDKQVSRKLNKKLVKMLDSFIDVLGR